MYRIGEFSKIVGITTKTLRYYDAEGILSPTYRDKETGYRLYSETDIEKASIIADIVASHSI
jgi:DNA-binding transcriptional MerR regulator